MQRANSRGGSSSSSSSSNRTNNSNSIVPPVAVTSIKAQQLMHPLGILTARHALFLIGLAIIYLQLRSINLQHRHVLLTSSSSVTGPGGALSSPAEARNCIQRNVNGHSDDNSPLWDFQPRTRTDEIPTWLNSTSIPSRRRPLNFVHIPKNGGSTIIEAAIQYGLNWGDCLFQQEWPGRVCPQLVPQVWPQDDPEGYGRVWWHTPIHQLPSTSGNYTNPYANFDLFAVLRNPYTRVLSEFYYHCHRFPNLCKGLDGRRAARVLNRNIQKSLKTIFLAPHKSVEYYYHEGHWIPQYDYIYNRKGQRIVEHVLHLETLEQEWSSLLAVYNLSDMTLPQKPVKQKTRRPLEQQQQQQQDHGMIIMDYRNLTLETLKFIEVVYQRDFQLGGYPMLSHKFA